MTTARYTLTARHDGQTYTQAIDATSEHELTRHCANEQEALDWDATGGAIMRVMNEASTRREWAKGAITLARPDGTVIHEMPAQ